MSDTVFILGAGASKKAGVPLMGEFLDVAQDLLRKGEVKGCEGSFSQVFEAIGALQSVHSKSELDIHNVESVFAAFEMGRLLGKFPGKGPDMDELLAAFRVLITKTIEKTLDFPVGRDRTVCPPMPYEGFVNLLVELTEEAKPRQAVSLITFNYDLALDYAIQWKQRRVDYAIGEARENPHFFLLKLHGSTNWARCSECGTILPYHLEDYFHRRVWQPHGFAGVKVVRLEVAEHLGDLEHCGRLEPEPVIVPPTWNKGDYHRVLSSVWSRAAHELGTAENVFVIGYSLPDSDHFFRFLYSLGSQGPKVLKRFWVFDPDKAVRGRFERLLGPGARARFRFFERPFEGAMKTIQDDFA